MLKVRSIGGTAIESVVGIDDFSRGRIDVSIKAIVFGSGFAYNLGID
jgi:hypothetical protein